MFEHIPYLAFLAPIALFFQQGRAFISQLFSFLIRNEEVTSYPHRFITFLQAECKQINFGNVKYGASHSYVKNLGAYLNCWFIFRPRYIFLYKGFVPIIVTSCSWTNKVTYLNIFNFHKLLSKYIHSFHKETLNENKNNQFYSLHEISGKSRAVKNYTSIDSEVKSESQSKSIERLTDVHFEYLNVTPPIGFNNSDLSSSAPFTEKSKYFFTKEALNILNHVEEWLGSRTWYDDRQINWRKSCLLIGKPGGGKSQLILEISKKLKLNLYKFDLTDMDNKELSHQLDLVQPGSIILFEDLDVIWEGRKNMLASDNFCGISFDYFINKLSGIGSIKNCFVFATTNHKEKLDPALIRPGRFDEIVEIKPLTKEGKLFIAEKMLDLWPDMIYKVVTNEEETAAEFENRITQIALDLYWKDKQAKEIADIP